MASNNPHITPANVPYFKLEVADCFAALTPQQRLYAHFMNKAAWAGASVCAMQVSSESHPLLCFFFRLFNANSVDEVYQHAEAAGVGKDDIDYLVDYAALLYSNMGNYLSFGDSKFIPRLSSETFLKILSSLPHEAIALAEEFHTLQTAMYSLEDNVLSLGFAPKGTTSYYSPNIVEADATLVNRFLTSKRISPENTRVWKELDGTLKVLIASAAVREETHQFEGSTIVLSYGDYASYMGRVAASLTTAAEVCENPTQAAMLSHYVKHFQEGDIDDHKKSQAEWVKDKGPNVETNIGFIETYRDPSGVRAEWEGFVAIVNKDQSRKFDELVGNGETFISRLPWGKAFEKDSFSRPDFTSLEVLGFSSSGIPAGICIPNYDDIRQNVGFKNVYLGNVIGAMNFNDKLNFLTDADWEVYKTHFFPAMSVGVGVHELLGHGTGKLLQQKEDGTLNFDKDTIINPLTQKPVTSWYLPGETYSGKFGGLSNAYEECRAEAVALYLGLERDLLSIFGQTTEEDQDRTVHVLWLNMVRAGVVGLEFYSPDIKQWRQAHMRARYCILQTLLRAPNSIVTIEPQTTAEGKQSFNVTLDTSRIRTDGRAAIGHLLNQLNINKSTGDVTEGTRFFEELTEVTEPFLQTREIVMNLRKPRKQFVQPHTRLSENGGHDAVLVEFEASAKGAIQAMVTRHREIPL